MRADPATDRRARILVPADILSALDVPAVGYRDRPESGPLDAVEFYVPPYLGGPHGLEVTARMPRLRVVQLLTAGYEGALSAVPAGVAVCNAAGVHDASTAELAVALMLASLRGLDTFARAMPAGGWLHTRREALADKTVVVVGAGGVGRAIARRVEAFDARAVLVGRTARPGVVAVGELPHLIGAADVVALAVPLDASTSRMVDDRFLDRLKDGALLVNVARGGVVDTEALTRQVIAGRLRAGLDVTDPEPLPPDHPLWHASGALISPHVGGDTSAFLPRARRLVAAQARRFCAGDELLHVVS